MKAPSTPLAIRIITHNIRYATPTPTCGEEPWPLRLPKLLSSLRFNTLHNAPSLICLQEVLHSQLHDLLHGLNALSPGETWSHIGTGRDDGAQAGEYNPILYRASVWSVSHARTLWLSPTPDRPSTGWDAASRRILTQGVFRHRESGLRLVALNTHLDDQGAVARARAAGLIVEVARGWTPGPAELALFLAGDFNCEVGQEAFRILNGVESPLRELRELVEEGARYGDVSTFTGFDGEGDGEGLRRIDFLFVGDKSKTWWKAKGYAVLENRFEDGVYASDHRAVVGDLELLPQ
ncbi:hypothetical protein LTR50_001480 [Elasticomyces elasticus]|nr:hypothetical protein LTR50_001480 [Elasticomyces elasticus]